MDHHVYFWLREENKNPADRATFENALAGLFEIPTIKSGRWAVPAAVTARPVVDQSWDYALTIQFDDLDGHDAYMVHPIHQQFVADYQDWRAQTQIKDLA